MSYFAGELKLIVRIGRVFRDDRLRAYGIDSFDSDLLLAINRMPDASQDRIGAERVLTKSTMTRHLAMLEEKGLICRTVRKDDRRVNDCSLTEEGKRLVPALRDINAQWSKLLTECLSETETGQLQDMLDRMLRVSRAYMRGREKE